jgi:hypothetical protein
MVRGRHDSGYGFTGERGASITENPQNNSGGLERFHTKSRWMKFGPMLPDVASSEVTKYTLTLYQPKARDFGRGESSLQLRTAA